MLKTTNYLLLLDCKLWVRKKGQMRLQKYTNMYIKKEALLFQAEIFGCINKDYLEQESLLTPLDETYDDGDDGCNGDDDDGDGSDCDVMMEMIIMMVMVTVTVVVTVTMM